MDEMDKILEQVKDLKKRTEQLNELVKAAVVRKKELNDRLEQSLRKLEQVDSIIDDAMAEPLVGARALISLRWARKLIAQALGKEDV